MVRILHMRKSITAQYAVIERCVTRTREVRDQATALRGAGDTRRCRGRPSVTRGDPR